MEESDLYGKVWEFGRAGGPVISRQVHLLPNGRLGCHLHANEHRWQILDGMLVFSAFDGAPRTRFEEQREENGARVFEGPFVPDPAVRHLLREVAPHATLAPAAAGVTPTVVKRGPRRRNLVVLRANEASLHSSWPIDIAPETRSWDVCISWYGSTLPTEVPEPCEMFVAQQEDRKYQAIHKLFHVDSPFWQYDYVMLPDDDLMTTWRGINIAFELMRDHNLSLAQPSLSADSFVMHDITRQHPGTVLRYTSFVEVMTPIFSRDALRLCAPTFGASRSAFGLDHVWPKMLGEPRQGVGVLDAVSVTHTRPMAGSYSLESAVNEGRAIMHAYSVWESYGELGRIHA